MFEAFSRIRSGDFQAGGIPRGSGLGLVINKHIIQIMGGDISFVSRVGVGSTFFFSVPFSIHPREQGLSPPPAAADATQLQTCTPRTCTQSLHPARMIIASECVKSSVSVQVKEVLIVDDVSSIRKLLGRCVSQLGFQVYQAADGAEAVLACSLKSFPLVLMDNIMPNVRGVDACREIRAHEEATQTKKAFIVGMTGNTLSDDMAEFMNCGCDVVMAKPINWSTFKELLKSHDLIPEQ